MDPKLDMTAPLESLVELPADKMDYLQLRAFVHRIRAQRARTVETRRFFNNKQKSKEQTK